MNVNTAEVDSNNRFTSINVEIGSVFSVILWMSLNFFIVLEVSLAENAA